MSDEQLGPNARSTPPAIGMVATGPIATIGGRLRGQPYASVRAALGPPQHVEPPGYKPRHGKGQVADPRYDIQITAGLISWAIVDPGTGRLSGEIRLDIPRPMIDRSKQAGASVDRAEFQSQENVHISRELPSGDLIDEHGVVVQRASTSAHIEIACDDALSQDILQALSAGRAGERKAGGD